MLSDKDLTRYDRQIKIEAFGKKGQENLKKAHIVIAGAGGLGSSVALYLTAAGAGHITIIDHENIELSNLNRQILHWEKDIGCLLYTSPSPRDRQKSRMPSSA